jgi:ABC-type multidrug transport system ATPase subunit
VVERLCDRVAIINQGKLVLEGPMAEMHGASETLEDAFVRAVGVGRTADTLDWL